MILIYATFPTKTDARAIALRLLKKKLIACANIFPVQSNFLWKGKIEDSKEWVGIFKTRKENWNKLKNEIKKMHAYKIPCIIKIDVEANRAFEKWLQGELK